MARITAASLTGEATTSSALVEMLPRFLWNLATENRRPDDRQLRRVCPAAPRVPGRGIARFSVGTGGAADSHAHAACSAHGRSRRPAVSAARVVRCQLGEAMGKAGITTRALAHENAPTVSRNSSELPSQAEVGARLC